jgi:hypothetical protein
MDRVLLACTASLAIALAACNGRNGDAANEPGTDESASAAASYAQDEWVTIDGVDFPARMARVGPEIQEAYVFAAKHPEVLQYMPCYCGCEQEQPPHQSNVDCFVDQIDRSGERPRVTIDPMGFG